MSSYSRNKYRCLLKPHNVIVSHDNNIPNPHLYPCYPGPYPGYPCIGPEPYNKDKPIPTPHYGYGPYGYPGGPYGYGSYGPYGYGSYGPYVYPGGLYGPYPYSQQTAQQTKERINPKNIKPKNENIGNVGNMEPHCEYYSSSSSSDSDRYRRRYRRYAVSEKEFTEKDSNRVFDEQNQKPYPIPKPRPDPTPGPTPDPKPNLIEEVHGDKKSFAKPLVKLLTKFTTSEKEVNELIQEDEKKEKNEKNLIFLKV